MMYFIYTIIIISLIISLVFFDKLKHFLRVRYLARNFAGPKGWPLLGNANLFLWAKPKDIVYILRDVFNNYGKTVKFFFCFQFALFLLDIKDIEVVLGTHMLLVKSKEYQFLKNWLCEGLLISKPPKWFQRRKILTPAFHFKILEQFVEVFDRSTRVFVNNLQKAAEKGNGLIIMDNWVNLVTLDIICETFAGSFAVLATLMVVSIVMGLLLYFFKYKRIIEMTSNIASPPSWPIIGHAHHFIGNPPHMNIIVLNEFVAKYGKTLKIWLGPELNLFCNEIKDVETVLSGMRFNNKADEYLALEPWLREGLLVSGGQKWHRRRKIITPAFHFKSLNDFIAIFEKNSRVLLENLETEYRVQGKQGFNIYEWVNYCTLDTICETAMGVSLNAQTNVNSEYVRAVKTISNVLHKRMFNIFYRFNLTYKFTKLAREEKKALNILHGFTEKIIIQRREEILKRKENLSQTISDDVGSKRKKAFLDILLQSEIDGKPLTNLDIREEVDTFMFEGHDTTSSAITFCFYNLAMNPECQQKCFEEIIQVFGKDKSKPVTYDSLNNLHYVELCIKETLRLYPSVPILGRHVTEECEINGKIIPAGTNIGISPLHLGRQEELFPEAKKFKPERFTMDFNTDKKSPYAYIPFSAGPRNCIGQKFAMLEVKTVVTNVLRHYELEYAGNKNKEILLIAELILRPKDPLMFKIKPRVY